MKNFLLKKSYKLLNLMSIFSLLLITFSMLSYNSIYANTLTNKRNGWKKSGIKKLGEGIEIPKTDNIARGTFGWGSVHDEFPLENKQGTERRYFYYNPNGYFQLCECGQIDEHSTSCSMYENSTHKSKKYTVIWRKK